MSEFEGRGKSRDVGYVSARRSAPAPRERTAKEKAEDAVTLARNLDGFEQRVHDGIAAMSAAAQANDCTAWDVAKREADAGVRDLRACIAPALAAANDATDSPVRERLATIKEVLKEAENAMTTASATPPIPRAPELRIADDLLAALPPDHQVSPAKSFYETAQLAVEWVFRERANTSDIAAFKEIVAAHHDHEIARRFRRFGREKQGELLAVLEKNEVKLPAREREQERKREAAAAAASPRAPVGETSGKTSVPVPARQPTDRDGAAELASVDRAPLEPVPAGDTPEQRVLASSEIAPPEPEPAIAGELEQAADDVALVQRKARGAADVEHGSGDLAETFDPESEGTRSEAPSAALGSARAPLGPQIAVATGAIYVGEGIFQIPELPGVFITVQRTTTAARTRRTASEIVLEIPRGLADEELARVAIEQLSLLRTESPATTEEVAAGGVRDAADPLPHHEQIQRSFGDHRVDHVRAQVGGPAADAAAQIGATAYATGDRVGFADSPSLHTAAHEAAHVVQQRAGVALKGNIGQAGDEYEQHADAVADQVVRGESAEALLDEMAPRASGGGGATSAVQRKEQGAQAAGATAAAGEHELVRQGNQTWQVFAASGKPYIIEARDGKPGAWVVRDWVKAAPDCQQTAGGYVAPSCARELLTAMGWVEPGRLERAAARLIFRFARSYAYLPMGANSMNATGLPDGKDAVAERGSNGGLKATIRLDDPSLPSGTAHAMTASEQTRAIQALAELTGLEVDRKELPFLQRVPAVIEPWPTGNGVLFFEWDRTVCQTLFGFDAYERWLTSKPPEQKPDDKTPKLKLENYYKRPIPGELSHHADIVESGEQIRLEALVNWPVDTPNPAIYEIVPMVTPSKFGTVSLLQCNWRFERLAAGGTTPAAPAAAASAAQEPRSDAAAASDTSIARATSTAGPTGTGAAAATATAPAVSSASPAASPVSPGAVPEQAATEIAEVFHRFKLAPDEASATFRVRCDARFDAYFTPTTFTRDVVVMSSAAALSSLRTAAFTGLGGDDAARRGGSWTADASAALTASPPTGGADATARGRATQRTQLEAVRAHLGNNPASADAVAAIDRELARQAKTEQLLAQDRARGWQPFQLRGTYLSRTEGLASGPLDLHGTVHVEHEYDGSGGEAGIAIYRNEYVVQIRDLSRRFEQQDFTFEGRGDSFDRALGDAFEDLAVAYPKGMVAIEAEQLASAGAADGEAVVGARTGKVVGFQRSTETTWKKVKETVWDPVASLAVNLGAIALMTLVPGSAAIVAPAIIAYNSIPAVDRIATESTRGTLTTDKFATAAGEIALNLLPVLGRARPFTAGWFAIETANWGGQVALMTATAVDIAHGLQAQQVAALAAEYEAFLQLQQRSLPSDPNLAAAEAAIRNRAAEVSNEISKQIKTQILENGIVMVTGSVIHHTAAHARTAIVENLSRRVPGSSAPDAVRAPDTAPPRPVGSDRTEPPQSGSPTDRTTTPRPDRGTTGPAAAPPARAPIVLTGDDVLARDVARNVIPRPGYVDVVVHGDSDSFWVIRSDVDISIDQRAFATYLRKHGLDGQKIRLISCETGKHPQGVAQHLANQLKVEVLAPNDVAWVHWDGTITIGDKDQNIGSWVPFERKASQRSPELEAKRKSRQPSDDDASQKDDVDHDAGQTAITARHDQRARAQAATEAELSRLLGAHVVFDGTLVNGVNVKAHRVKKLFGFDLEVTEVRVGRDALLADVLAHKSTIETIERYNGVVGSLRKLADRYAAWRQRRQGQLDATPKHGSREWVTQQELLKLDVLLTQRRSDFGQGTVDERTVTGEIKFLEGRRAYHAEVLRSLEDHGRGADDDFTISGPDVGRVTQEAIASGYRLPGAAEGVQSDWYYYRHTRSDPSEFELALKPSAPYDSPSFQARVVGGRFTGIEVPKRTQAEEIPHEWTAEQVVTRLRATEGFKRYALMLEHNGFANRTVIDGVVQHMRSQRMNSGKPVTIDQVRHDVKEYFEPRIMERLLDPRLSDQASWQQLRALLDELPGADRGNLVDLPGADRGNLVEKWYRGRHLPNAQPHVNVGVERTSGLNVGQVEPRVIDMVDGNTAVEIKDVQGKLDDAQLGQLGAYLDMIEAKLHGTKGATPPKIQHVRYVFTKPEGAIANLKTFAKHLQQVQFQEHLEVRVFDWEGTQHSVATAAQALELQARLSATRKPRP